MDHEMLQAIGRANGRLKMALRTYLVVAGSPSAELAWLLLKAPDMFDAMAAGDTTTVVADLDGLATTLYATLLSHIQTRLTVCQRDLVGDHNKCGLAGTIANYLHDSRTRKLKSQGQLRDLVSAGLEVLRSVTGVDYPRLDSVLSGASNDTR